jgi:hypothetical protein
MQAAKFSVTIPEKNILNSIVLKINKSKKLAKMFEVEKKITEKLVRFVDV